MGKKMKGGELERPRSGSAITIEGNQTLEEFVSEQEAKELGEQLTPDTRGTYHKSRARHSEYKEPSGSGRILTRREINAENWEAMVMNEKTIDGVITSLLLSGREVSGKELMNNCLQQVTGANKKKYSTRSTYLFHKTDWGKFVENRRSAKGRAYKFVAAALECKPEELLVFMYKGSPKARETILEHHKGLRPYLEDTKKKESEEDMKKRMAGLREKRALKKKEREAPNSLSTVITNTVTERLGVDVSVGGRIEIVFKRE